MNSLEPIHYIAIALALGVIVLTWLLLSRSENVSTREVSPSADTRQSKPALLYFYSDTCPHAVRMTPELIKAEAILSDRFIMQKYLPGTEGFNEAIQFTNGATPFVLFVAEDGATPIPYSGDRTAESLVRFAESGGQSS